MTDLHYLSISEAGALIAKGDLSPVEYGEALLARIEKLDPKLDPDAAAPGIGDEYEYYEDDEEEVAAAAPAAVEPAELAAQLKQLVSPATQEPTTAGPGAAAAAAEEIEYYEDEDEVGGVQAANSPEP